MRAPRISALMPTADRRHFMPQAIAQFLAQDRDDAELVILDDGADPVADLIPADPRIRYFHDSPRQPLGAKRNRLCELARGDIILHWDDDDWYAPDRISRQVAALEASGADICGLDRVIFLSDDGERAWDYVYRGGGRWVCGASLAYRRCFWEQHRFAPIAAGEDTRWVFGAAGAAIHSMADNDILVARVHGGNTSPKRTDGGFYHKRDPGPVRALVAGTAARAMAPDIAPLANINACLVHEKPECVVDLVRNLRFLDPDSPILLYDGSPKGDLLDARLPWSSWGVEIVPNPVPMRWGALHRFALDCIRQLEGRDYDVMTIIDSDQLMMKRGYSQHLARQLAGKARTQLLSGNPDHQDERTRIGPARTARSEIALWRPWLSRFADGEAKFVHWSFWPATVIGRDAGREIASLFTDPELQAILATSKLWATEEILFPTFAALLGFEVTRNPCAADFIQYRTPWRRADVDRALATPDAFFIHPVPRRLDDPLRARIREANSFYRTAPALPPAPPARGAVLPLIETMRDIEGWLTDQEAEALLIAARAAVGRPDAAGLIVEIGSYCGKATFLLAKAARSAPVPAQVIAVDPFDGVAGSREERLERHGSTRARFDAMVAEHGLAPWIEVHVGHAADLSGSGPIDLLVLDGLHDYPAVASDFHALQHRLAVGARLVFHDYADYFPSVCAFVDELAADGHWKLESAAGTLRVLIRTA